MVISQLTNNLIKRKLLENYISKGGDLKLEDIDNFIGSFKALSTDKNKGLFKDFFDIGAIMFDKINIKEIIDFDIDITDFKTNSGNLKTEYHQAQENLNNLRDLKTISDLKIENRDIARDAQINFSETAINKFITFIKLVGLTELSVNDVYLIETDNVLHIELSPDHPIYTGSLEIKTW